MKDFKIEAPEGYIIDEENSTYELIKFKKVENKLPESWKELGKIKGSYIASNSAIKIIVNGIDTTELSINVFPTSEQARAAMALAQLLQLRDVYRDGWVPDFKNESGKYALQLISDKWCIQIYYNDNSVFSFQSAKIRNLFLENFKGLLEEVKPLFT